MAELFKPTQGKKFEIGGHLLPTLRCGPRTVMPAPLPHSLLEQGPPTGSCFPRPMKSPLFPHESPAGRAVTSAPRAALGPAWFATGDGPGLPAQRGPARPSTAAQSGLLRGMPPVSHRRSSCRCPDFPAWQQANPLLESPAGAEALTAVATCASHPGTRHMLQTPFPLTALALHLSQDKEARPILKSALRLQ